MIKSMIIETRAITGLVTRLFLERHVLLIGGNRAC
jgi:hypothetical protein